MDFKIALVRYDVSKIIRSQCEPSSVASGFSQAAKMKKIASLAPLAAKKVTESTNRSCVMAISTASATENTT